MIVYNNIMKDYIIALKQYQICRMVPTITNNWKIKYFAWKSGK